MKEIYFVYHDAGREARQSDGVEMCVIPEFNNEKIYFYCSEYEQFWDSIESAGDPGRSCDFKLRGTIRPATLEEIANEGLSKYVDTVKEYRLENKRISSVKYIHIKD